MRFFKDNQGGSEHSGGSVARIRLYDNIALSGTEVGTLDRIGPTVFTVNSTADGPDNLLQDGKCSTGVPQQCTLRAAVQQSNSTSGSDTINFAANLSGPITLTQGHVSIDSEPDYLTINGPKPGARVLTVSGNNASRVFFIADDASAVINNLMISNGNATTNGGAISADGDILTLTNVTVSGNSATSAGGGIYNSGNALTLNNSTVRGNQVNNGDGGGIRNFSGTSSSRNTIVANNTAATGPDASGTFSSQGNNLIGNASGATGFGGSDILGRNPLLGPLQDNGGPTDTHALLSRSPAMDKGANAGCPRTDQRGKARPMDGDGRGKAICDIGSFEKEVRRR